MEDKKYTFEDLVAITKRLRAKDGCPWDREQTHESLKVCMKEEAYEVIEAIENQDADNLCEELGDVLLQVTMHAQIGEEEGTFTLDQVTTGICEKLIRRHPHVFGSQAADTAEQVISSWEEIKKLEKQEKTALEGIERVPKALPACIRAQKIQKKAEKAGYLFAKAGQSLTKEQAGEQLFELINAIRQSGIDAEEALEDRTKSFMKELTLGADGKKG